MQPREAFVDLRGHLIHVFVEQVPIDVHRDVDRRVAELLLDRLRVGADLDEEARAGVSEIVDPHVTQP